MNFNRWYDKYPEFKSLLALLETIDERNLSYISKDFIQVVMSKYGDRFDEFIQIMSDNAPPKYGRWYDDDYDLHTCIEFIRILNEDEKKELINDLIMSLLSFVTNNDT